MRERALSPVVEEFFDTLSDAINAMVDDGEDFTEIAAVILFALIHQIRDRHGEDMLPVFGDIFVDRARFALIKRHLNS